MAIIVLCSISLFASGLGVDAVNGKLLPVNFTACEFTGSGTYYDLCDSSLTVPRCHQGERKLAECLDGDKDMSSICGTCESGSFQQNYNVCLQCRPCTVCDASQEIELNCTPEADTVCRERMLSPTIQGSSESSAFGGIAPAQDVMSSVQSPHSSSDNYIPTVHRTCFTDSANAVLTPLANGSLSNDGGSNPTVAAIITGVLSLFVITGLLLALLYCWMKNKKLTDKMRLEGMTDRRGSGCSTGSHPHLTPPLAEKDPTDAQQPNPSTSSAGIHPGITKGGGHKAGESGSSTSDHPPMSDQDLEKDPTEAQQPNPSISSGFDLGIKEGEGHKAGESGRSTVSHRPATAQDQKKVSKPSKLSILSTAQDPGRTKRNASRLKKVFNIKRKDEKREGRAEEMVPLRKCVNSTNATSDASDHPELSGSSDKHPTGTTGGDEGTTD